MRGRHGASLEGTWEYNGTVWQQKAASGPALSAGAVMAYDKLRQVCVMHGRAPGCPEVPETWEWDGLSLSWTLVSTNGPGVSTEGLTYDSARGKVVLFGGDTCTGRSDQTYEWDGSTWSLILTGGGPTFTSHTALAYDSADAVSVLFGGFNPGGVGNGQTWNWDGTTWTFVTGSGPPARGSHAMAYDSHRDRTVMFGGGAPQVPGTFMNDHWELHDGTWAHVVSGCVSGRRAAAMVYDEHRKVAESAARRFARCVVRMATDFCRASR